MDGELRSTYDILEKIGSGSGGIVYKAYHKRLRKTVVLKQVIDPEHRVMQRRQEVDILKNVNHTYLPQVLDFLETDEGVFTVMSYIPGKSFQQLLKERAMFTKEDLLRWALQICSALNYLHTRDIPIIHGDIKPSNIMLRPDGDICLIDFNISFFFNENTVLGCTRGYTSPEQFWAVSSKQKRADVQFVIDNKADIYSVGATLYHLATGNVRADYSHDIDIDKLTAVIGPRFAQVIAKATDVDPKKRYNSAADMYRALQKVPEKSRRDLKKIRKSKSRAVAGVAAAVVVMCAGAGGYLAYTKYQNNKYNDYVAEAKSAIIAGQFTEADQKSDDAIEIMDDRAEAYYWKDYVLYCKGNYEACADQAETHISKVKPETEESIDRGEHKSLADLYGLRGTSLLECHKTEAAVQAFQKAESEYSELMRADNYRDYAVALAQDGQVDEAKEKMDKAESADQQLPEYSTAFTEGEIARMNEEDYEALDHFGTVIEELEHADLKKAENFDEELMLYRAFMERASIYREQKEYSLAVEELTEAKGRLGESRQTVLDREIAHNYSESEQYEQAAEYYQKAGESEGAVAADWNDYAVMELKIGNGTGSIGQAEEAADRAKEGADKYQEMLGVKNFKYWNIMAKADAIKEKFRGAEDDQYYRGFLENYDNAEAAFNAEGSAEQGQDAEAMKSLKEMKEEVEWQRARTGRQ